MAATLPGIARHTINGLCSSRKARQPRTAPESILSRRCRPLRVALPACPVWSVGQYRTTSVCVGVCRSVWLLKLVLKLMLMPRSTCYARHGLLWAASVPYPGMTAIKAICGPSSS